MPKLTETIARLRELLKECERREPYDSTESVRLHQVFAVFNATALETMPQLLDAAEEVDALRADKERLDWLDANAVHVNTIEPILPDDEWVIWWEETPSSDPVAGKRHAAIRDAIDEALQTNGRGSESTAEAKQEASPARKETNGPTS